MTLDADDLKDLAKLVAIAAVGVAIGYAGIAWWETRHALYAGTTTSGPVPVTLEAHRRVDRVVGDVRELMTQVESYYATHARWPETGDVRQTVPTSHPDLGKLVKEYALGAGGRLRVTLAGPGLEDRRVVFTPHASSGNAIKWTCAGPAAWRDWLSPICRS